MEKVASKFYLHLGQSKRKIYSGRFNLDTSFHCEPERTHLTASPLLHVSPRHSILHTGDSHVHVIKK